MKIKISELREIVERVIASRHYSAEEAKRISEVLIYAELSGKNTQGVLKLFGTEPLQNIVPRHTPKIIKETNLSALIDGGGNAGMLAAQLATDKVIELASKAGFAIVALNNTFSSIGAIGFYARKIAQHDLIAIVASSSPRTVLQFGSIDPTFGTNPIAFGFPTQRYPIVFDMAASAITWYGLVRAKALGQKLPDNVAIDKDGNITLDPEEAMKGAILPFDRSYKGSGIAMVVELLAGVLSGASYVFDEGDWGTTLIALSPNLLMDTEIFKQKSSDLVTKVKSARPKDGQKIRIPGYDLEAEIIERLKNGEIEIEEKIITELKAASQAAEAGAISSK